MVDSSCCHENPRQAQCVLINAGLNAPPIRLLNIQRIFVRFKTVVDVYIQHV